MVMLQFKVIMRNPNKSKFSMVAERGLCIPRMFKEKSMVLFFSTSDFQMSTKLWKERCAPRPGRSGLLSLHTEMLGPKLLANETLLTTVGPRSRSRLSVWLFLPSQDIPVL